MTCVSDSCRQGRDRCPTPGLCTNEGAAYIDTDDFSPALFIIGLIACAVIVGVLAFGVWQIAPLFAAVH